MTKGIQALVAASVISFCAVAWTWVAGKDVSWDVLNHHLYIPFAWATGRIDADFYGAGSQAYQNPLGYFPFYLLVTAGLPAWLVGMALALLHAVAVYCIWAISCQLWKSPPARTPWPVLATLLAALSPTYLNVAGTSSNDPIGAALVLAALGALLWPRAGWLRPSLAGTLLGLAFAVKISNGIFIAAAGMMVLWQLARHRTKPIAVLQGAAGGLIGLAAGMGWHAWFLWDRLGNPFFPFANDWFRSPYASTEPMGAQRFLPDTAWQWVSRLWEMAGMRRYVYQEPFVPDLRPAALLLVLTLGAVFFVWKTFATRKTADASAADDGAHSRNWTSADGDLAIFCIVSYVLWLASSGNGRYAIPLLMLVGVWVVRAAWLLLPDRPARCALTALAAAQLMHFVSGGDLRVSAEPWDAKPYLQVEIPDLLRYQPFLHLTVGGAQTHASIATLFHPDGALVSPIGPTSLPFSGPIGDQLKLRYARWKGRMRLLLPAPGTGGDLSQVHTVIDTMIERLGVRVEWQDCVQITYHPSTAPSNSPWWWVHPRLKPEEMERRLLSCKLAGRPIPALEDDPDMRRAEQVFARLEQECPLVYGPAPMTTERSPATWERLYSKTDTAVVVSKTKGVIATRERVLNARYLGTIDQIISGHGDLQCRLWPLTTPD